jgi:7,8-dihydroneopterin aldolase/epimerase/oxygenase
MVRQVFKDRMTLAGIKLYPHIGITAKERSMPQECQADLSVWANFKAAAETDDLNQSFDYCHILTTIQKVAGIHEYRLLETLAYKIARSVLQEFPVARVRVQLRKKPSELLEDLAFVEVEVEES